MDEDAEPSGPDRVCAPLGAFSGAVARSAILTLSPGMGIVGTRMGMTFNLTGIAILVGTPIAGTTVYSRGICRD